MQQPKIIFFNIGWMAHYTGKVKNDRTVGNHGYLKEHTHGHECYNFLPYNNKVYAYTPLPHENNIKIQRIGANAYDDYIDNVIVVFIARDPSTSKTVIVGWYTKARLYIEPQEFPTSSRNIDHAQLIYRATANDTDFSASQKIKEHFI